MGKLTKKKRFELYKDTLKLCGLYLLNENEETIAYKIYEDFDIGVHSFLYHDNLEIFYNKGWISLEKLNKSKLLRKKFIEIQNTTEWDIENFKTSKKWKEIMILTDELKTIF